MKFGGKYMKSKKIMIVDDVSVIVVFGLIFGMMYIQYYGNWTPSNRNIAFDTDLGSQDLELPDWNMTLSDSSVASLHDFRGQVVIIDLMATWCSSCETQIGYLKSFQELRTSGIKIITLSVDISETPSMMADYKVDHEFDWDCGLEESSSFSSYLDVEYIPTIAVIDSEGYLRWVHEGTWSASSMNAALTSMGI